MRLTKAQALLVSLIMILSFQSYPIARAATAPVLESHTSNEGNAVASITVGVPSGTSAGDLLILICTTDGTGSTLNTPTGSGNAWNVLLAESQTNGQTTASWYKTATGSEGSLYTVTWSGTEDAVIGCFRISGWDNSDFPHKSNSATGSSGDPVFPSVTTTVDDCLLLRFWGMDDDDDTEPIAGNPAGHTQLYALATGSSTGECSGAATWRTWVSYGVTGTATWDQSATSEGWYAATIAIAPTSGGGTEYERAASQSLTWVSTASRGIIISRPASQTLGWDGTVSRMLIFGRTASQSLGWDSTASKVLEFGRIATQALSWDSTVDQILGYGRVATQGLTWGSTIIQVLDYGRIASQTLTWASSVVRGIDITRGVTQSLTIVSEAQRLIEVTRGAAQIIFSSWGVTGGMAGIYNAAASLTLYIKALDAPLIGGNSNTSLLMLLGAVFYIVELSMRRKR